MPHAAFIWQFLPLARPRHVLGASGRARRSAQIGEQVARHQTSAEQLRKRLRDATVAATATVAASAAAATAGWWNRRTASAAAATPAATPSAAATPAAAAGAPSAAATTSADRGHQGSQQSAHNLTETAIDDGRKLQGNGTNELTTNNSAAPSTPPLALGPCRGAAKFGCLTLSC
jgi:hypothetical protein